jgi:serine/threonine-protein kinase
MKNNGEIVQFLKQKDYVMLNNALGNGSFGKTVLLKDPFIDELFVAKKYEPESDDDKERFFKNFIDEIKILYKLNHKNVVRVYNYYVYENISTGYILMEFIEGDNIGDFISEYKWFEAITLDDIFSQIIDGFMYIEEHGIVHRDIREGNILIDKTGIVKIIDFGIGKIVDRLADCDDRKDSLVDEINRPNTLPLEQYEGIYTSQTDMFYIAELFNRLIRLEALDIKDSDFTYHSVLEKMMERKPDNRYSTFAEVREAIGKYDFANMPITQNDKDIYQNFSNRLYKSMISFKDERKFNYDTNIFVQKLETLLKENLFEDYIQNNSGVISSVVSSAYTYSSQAGIERDVVANFFTWFKQSTMQSQQLILNNIILKLSRIKIVPSEPEVPF